jgi:hypothetical protein
VSHLQEQRLSRLLIAVAKTTVSLVVMTKNSSWRIERTLVNLRGKVDEIVVGVDDTSDDDTTERARRHTRHVFPIRNEEGYIEPHIRTLVERCSCDWVLRLDDDELMSTNFAIDAIPPDIIEAFDLIGFQRVWVTQRDPALYFGTGPGGEAVPQFRMMKRTASWSFVSDIHTPGFLMKPSYIVPGVFMFHLSLVDKSALVRRAQFDFYESIRHASWNTTYTLNPEAVAASARAKPCCQSMHPPLDLIRLTAADVSDPPHDDEPT